ncbi:MAG: hypothetical protein JXA73_25945 [Acidobacteria bacterium]|nr:hypothetical protein [Acidobacteriota bacterium]
MVVKADVSNPPKIVRLHGMAAELPQTKATLSRLYLAEPDLEKVQARVHPLSQMSPAGIRLLSLLTQMWRGKSEGRLPTAATISTAKQKALSVYLCRSMAIIFLS